MNLPNRWPPNLVANSREIGCGGEAELLSFQPVRDAQRKPAASIVRGNMNFLIKNCFLIQT